MPNFAKALKHDLSKIGITAKVQVEDENTEMNMIVMPRFDDTLPRPGMGVFVFTCPDFGLYHTFFLSFITYHTDGPWSIMGDAQADDLFADAIQTIEPDAQQEAWKTYHRYMREQHYYMPIMQRIVAYGAAKGLEFHPGEILDFTNASWR